MIVVASFAVMMAVLCAGKVWTDYHVLRTEKQFPPVGQFITVEKHRLHYVRAGAGRSLVLIHGGFGSVYDFTLSIFPPLSQKFDVVAIDRPGHGYSSRMVSGITLFDQARLLRRAFHEMGLNKPVIIGHSIGAAVGLALLSEYPEEFSGLVSLGGYVTPFDGPPHPMHLVPIIPCFGALYLSCLIYPFGCLVKNEIGRKVFLPKAPMIDYLKTATSLALRPNHFKANAEDIRLLNTGLDQIGKKMALIKHPVAVLSGDGDQVSLPKRHAARLVERLPNAKMIWLEGVGHQPAFGAPERIDEAIEWVFEKSRLSV